MPAFALHPRLQEDTLELGTLRLSAVRLMNDARFPWVILVPQRPRISEVLDLTPDERAQLWSEVEQVAAALTAVAKPDKLNIATLGNVVPQLHVHVIARTHTDAAWPRPVWGVGEAQTYTVDAANAVGDQLRKALGLA